MAGGGPPLLPASWALGGVDAGDMSSQSGRGHTCPRLRPTDTSPGTAPSVLATAQRGSIAGPSQRRELSKKRARPTSPAQVTRAASGRPRPTGLKPHRRRTEGSGDPGPGLETHRGHREERTVSERPGPWGQCRDSEPPATGRAASARASRTMHCESATLPPCTPRSREAPPASVTSALPGLGDTAHGIRPAVAASAGRCLLSSRFETKAVLLSLLLPPPEASQRGGPKARGL